MPVPGKNNERAQVGLDNSKSIDIAPLSNLPEEKPTQPVVPTNENGKLVDPTQNSIESNPLSNIPE
jgi:hypothetical protein